MVPYEDANNSDNPDSPRPADDAPVCEASPIALAGSRAVAAIRAFAALLPADDSVALDGLPSARTAARVPLSAMQIVAGILKKNPAAYPTFDAAEATDAVEYLEQLGFVTEAIEALNERASKTASKRRGKMAGQTLALYASLKETARLSMDPVARGQLKELRGLLAKRPRRPRPLNARASRART